ncbi:MULTISPECIES: helix-turn-helix domain-containing protein [Nocardiaceae]|uniref:Winged helix-turn-helix domain-containing protein n=1 Tax=Rhodococcoides corynebacterioides TaxID=53972 RepID=A0ABS2KWD2_9NOCA|nr:MULTISPECIES: helix-turn-helix domain-containing protein [Rhodococcus]MBM7416258.1 hypothetical protein [Rhodococcus corynebacterioides]MBP1114511.1 hypothetical protein [Rhodococcus sp. PvP016]
MSVKEQISQELVRQGALDRLADRKRTRLILGAAASGLPQREISRCLHNVSQTTVNRILARAETDPDLDRTTPAEVIDRYAAGEIDEKDMMETLANWVYTFGGVRSVDGVDTDAYTSGDWDQVERAFYRGLLNDEQFEALMRRQNELLDRNIAASRPAR